MNIDEWFSEVAAAYAEAKAPLNDTAAIWLKEFCPPSPEQGDSSWDVANREVVANWRCNCPPDQRHSELIHTTAAVLAGWIAHRAERRETFGALERIQEKFGRTLEQNYGIVQGPFLDVAKAYWTFRLELDDIAGQEVAPSVRYSVLTKAVYQAESRFGGCFFPMPGPHTKSQDKDRAQTQRAFLAEFAPSLDADRFVRESPILRGATESRSGCAGAILAVVAALVAVAAVGHALRL